MPLLEPLNDASCLRKLHESVQAYMQTDEARALAGQFATVDELIEFIRNLEQRDDLGDPRDGPRLACDVTQRLRLPALDPNCFERLALFLAVALIIDPSLALTSASMMLDQGMHSFPLMIVDGIPQVVDLSPQLAIPLNAMSATAYQLRNASPLSEPAIAPWFAEMAWNACTQNGAEECYHTAMQAIRNSLLTGQPLCDASAVDCVLRLAHQDAQLFGAAGRTAFDRVDRSLRNLSVKLDTRRVAEFVNGLLDTAEPLAGDALKAALIAKFGPAAAIALHGVNLGTAQVKQSEQKNEEKNKENGAEDEAPSEQLVNGKVPVTSESKLQRLRRMSLAFREPRRKE